MIKKINNFKNRHIARPVLPSLISGLCATFCAVYIWSFGQYHAIHSQNFSSRQAMADHSTKGTAWHRRRHIG
jgi:hypothetical protein